MQWLAALCVRRPVFASVLILSLTVIGVFSFTQLGIDQFPNVDIPALVTTRLPGAAPEQVESEVTDKIEEAVNTISGIDTLTSTSSEGVSQVVVSFRRRRTPTSPRRRSAIGSTVSCRCFQGRSRSRSLRSAIRMLSRSDGCADGQRAVRDITEYADKVLRRQLESADGVGQVLVLGGRRRINVVLDADRLRAQNLTVNDVARALQAQNSDIPGGRIDQGAQSLTMRTRGRVESPAEFGSIVIRETGGYPVQVRDVARIEDGVADAQTVASVNGDPTVLLQIRKQSGTNTVEIVNAVKARLTQLEETLPPATGFASCAIRPSSSKHPSRASRNTSSSDRCSPRSSCSSSSKPSIHLHRRHLDSHVHHRHVRSDLV